MNDRRLQVDGMNIQGYTNQQAVEVLRHTGQTVHLKLVRSGFHPEDIPPAVVPSVIVLPPTPGGRDPTLERTDVVDTTAQGTSGHRAWAVFIRHGMEENGLKQGETTLGLSPTPKNIGRPRVVCSFDQLIGQNL